jgi:hypothetical protein
VFDSRAAAKFSPVEMSSEELLYSNDIPQVCACIFVNVPLS